MCQEVSRERAKYMPGGMHSIGIRSFIYAGQLLSFLLLSFSSTAGSPKLLRETLHSIFTCTCIELINIFEDNNANASLKVSSWHNFLSADTCSYDSPYLYWRERKLLWDLIQLTIDQVRRYNFYINFFIKQNFQRSRFFQIHKETRQRRIRYYSEYKMNLNTEYIKPISNLTLSISFHKIIYTLSIQNEQDKHY